jgi:hypothetical protein
MATKQKEEPASRSQLPASGPGGDGAATGPTGSHNLPPGTHVRLNASPVHGDTTPAVGRFPRLANGAFPSHSLTPRAGPSAGIKSSQPTTTDAAGSPRPDPRVQCTCPLPRRRRNQGNAGGGRRGEEPSSHPRLTFPHPQKSKSHAGIN